MDVRIRYLILTLIICMTIQMSSREWSATIHQAMEKQSMFYMTYGCSPYRYVFADAYERNIQLAFLGPDTIIVENKPSEIIDFAFVDKYRVKQLEGETTYCVVKLASTTRPNMIACNEAAKLPFRIGYFESKAVVFPILNEHDTIFMAKDLSHVQIREFSFARDGEIFNEYIENGYKLKPVIDKKMWKALMKAYRKQKRENGEPWAIDAILPYCDEKYLK